MISPTAINLTTMSKILLTHSYFLRLDPKQWKQQQPYPPLATLYAAAVLRQAGHEVFLFDAMFSVSPEEINPFLQRIEPDFLVVYDDGFNYLTKMCLTNMRYAAFGMCKIAKGFGCKVVVSSSDATDHSEEYVNNGADFILIGEGEKTLLELITGLGSDTPTETIPGLVFQQGTQFIKTEPRKVLNDLDALPMPAWDLIDIEKYKSAWLKKNGYFSLNMVTTRGCPFKCNWCAKPIYGNRYNTRTPANVVEELKYLLTIFGPQHIWFCDDIFGLKPGWVEEFAVLIKKENLRFRFKIQARVDLLCKGDTIEHLAAAGCETIWVGAESGSQKILDAMDKGTKVEQIHLASALMRKHGIKPAFFLQLGYPGETKEDIKLTMKMLLDLMPDDIGVSVSYPLPGTKFYENVKADISKKTNWIDSDELAMMYNGPFTTSYYKKVHRYIHKTFRKKQGYANLTKIVAGKESINCKTLRSVLAMAWYTPSLIQKVI